MRLWHYKLITFLPDKQLLAQWRELNSIFKKQDKHILIDYVYEYDKNELFLYSLQVIFEMQNRHFKIKSFKNLNNYFLSHLSPNEMGLWRRVYYKKEFHIFPNHHTDRYLLQCFYNLQEKYDRGQKDFSKEQYLKLEEFIKNEIH